MLKRQDSGSADPPIAQLITVFILNWNRRQDLLLAIDSVKRQTYPNIDILVVDSASSDGSCQAVREQHADVRLIELDRNYGCPGGRNRGIPHARGEYVFYMDNDAILHEQAVERAFQSMMRDERIMIVGGVVKMFDDIDEVDVRCDMPDETAAWFAGQFHGGVSLHRRCVYDRVGMYPEEYVYAGEEGHLSMRIMNEGLLILKDPGVILWHKKGGECTQSNG